MANRVQLIRQLSSKYGLDPNAVLAIASVEGQRALHGGVSIGDNGTSFGPFQLHVGGALPKGKGSLWAHSPAGIEYAIRKMATVAQGLQGQAAVQAISSRFERPADVGGEVSKAMGFYGKVGGAGDPAVGQASMGSPGAPGAAGAALAPAQGLTSQALKSMAASVLLQQSAATAAGGQPDSSGLLALAAARQQVQAAQQTYGAQPTKAPLTPIGPASQRPSGGGGIRELFYDPLGGIKNGAQIGAIGHHSDHVHVALGTFQSQLAAERQARKMGLHVGEEQDSDFHNVHAAHSYHNTDFPGTHFRQAADVSGDPGAMASYFRWVAANFK